ncbi:MAG: Bax inhibitor-1/YccA family protein [Chitinophagales bacterium]|nr:Bax inhibitor-1/YccA family protein [Chitinophagales bacterium]
MLNFDFIERAQKYKYPSYMEAYAAFGLMVSIVWQYLSILRLLKKTKN